LPVSVATVLAAAGLLRLDLRRNNRRRPAGRGRLGRREIRHRLRRRVAGLDRLRRHRRSSRVCSISRLGVTCSRTTAAAKAGDDRNDYGSGAAK